MALIKLPDLNLRQRLAERMAQQLITAETEASISRIPEPIGSFGYDAWGYNEVSFKLALGDESPSADHIGGVIGCEETMPSLYGIKPLSRLLGTPYALISLPLPRAVSSLLNWNAFFPPYLINYFRYPVILDGRLFVSTFGWKPRRGFNDIFTYYRNQKLPASVES